MPVINGSPAPEADGSTLSDYIARSGLRADRVAVEVNGAVIRKSDYPDRVLAKGDRVEIVHFMGGG